VPLNKWCPGQPPLKPALRATPAWNNKILFRVKTNKRRQKPVINFHIYSRYVKDETCAENTVDLNKCFDFQFQLLHGKKFETH